MPTHRCNHHGLLAAEDTYVRPNGTTECRSCKRANARRYREANPEKIRELSRKYREANPVYHRDRARRWNEAHPDRVAQTNRRWNADNPEKKRAIARRRRALKKSQLGLWHHMETEMKECSEPEHKDEHRESAREPDSACSPGQPT